MIILYDTVADKNFGFIVDPVDVVINVLVTFTAADARNFVGKECATCKAYNKTEPFDIYCRCKQPVLGRHVAFRNNFNLMTLLIEEPKIYSYL